MALSRNYVRSILNTMTGKSSSAYIASTCYIGLLTADPSHDENGNVVYTEVSGTGYERMLLGSASAPIAQAMGEVTDEGTTTNTLNILFPEAESDWGTVTHFALFNTKEGGEPHLWGALKNPITISTGFVGLFKPGALEITLT